MSSAVSSRSRNYKTLDEYRINRGHPHESKNGYEYNQPKLKHRQMSSDSINNVKPLAPHPSSAAPPRRRSPTRDYRGESSFKSSPRSSNSRSRRPSKSPPREAVDNLLRKSAIQSVLKTFQCNESTRVNNSSSTMNHVHPHPRQNPHEPGAGLHNSLLEEESVKSKQSAFQPFVDDDSAYFNNTRDPWKKQSPLKKLMESPMKACRTNFTNDNEDILQSTFNCSDKKKKKAFDSRKMVYKGESDDAFLNTKDAWGDDEVDQVFRRSPKVESYTDPFMKNSRGRNGVLKPSSNITNEDDSDLYKPPITSAETNNNVDERFRIAAMDSVKKAIQFSREENVHASPRGSRGMLNPNPRDAKFGSSRKSPIRERMDMERNPDASYRSVALKDGPSSKKSELQPESTPATKYNLLDDSMEKQKEKYNTPIASAGVSRTTKKLRGNTPDTVQTAQLTPSPITEDRPRSQVTIEQTDSLSLISSIFFDKDGNGSITEKHHIQRLYGEWQKGNLQMKCMLAEEIVNWFDDEDAGGREWVHMEPFRIAAKDVINQIENEKSERIALKAENESLKRQLATYKSHIIEMEKKKLAEKIEDDDAQSVLSNMGLKAELVSWKAKLSEKESDFEEYKKKCEENESDYKKQIQKLTLSSKNFKSKAECDVLNKQIETLQEKADLYKEQLRESEQYVKELEDTIDDQLKLWQEEEETFRKEVTSLKEKLNQAAEVETKYESLQRESQELKKELVRSQADIKEIRTMNQKLEENKRSNFEIERSARETSERYEETIRIMKEKNNALENDLKRAQRKLDDMFDETMKTHTSNEQEVKKLKEQLEHASFRVQVMRNESPKRKRPSNNNLSEETTISQLMDQLKAADLRAEEAWEAKRALEESMISMRPDEIDGIKDGDAEEKQHMQDIVDALTKKLYDARSRSRRIAVKSEEELSKVREAEIEMRKLASKYEKQASEWKQKLLKLKQNYATELSTRRSVESTLRSEISVLRQNKSMSASTSLLPNSMKTHSNYIGKEIDAVIEITNKLQDSANLITKAKQKIGRDMLNNVAKNIDILKSRVSKLEVAAEEDKLQIENSLNSYELAINEYESKVNVFKNEIDASKENLRIATEQRKMEAEDAKKAGLALQQKIDVTINRLTTLEGEYREYKEKSELGRSGGSNQSNVGQMRALDVTSNGTKSDLDNKHDLIQLAPSDEASGLHITSKLSEKPPMPANSNRQKMKVQHGVDGGVVEVNLREDDNSIQNSNFDSNVDMITSYKSYDIHNSVEERSQNEPTKKSFENDVQNSSVGKNTSHASVSSHDSAISASQSQNKTSSSRISGESDRSSELAEDSEFSNSHSYDTSNSILESIGTEMDSGVMERRGENSTVAASRSTIEDTTSHTEGDESSLSFEEQKEKSAIGIILDEDISAIEKLKDSSEIMESFDADKSRIFDVTEKSIESESGGEWDFDQSTERSL
ncbi:predicted protein [Chaetoceros tenuissimus]|uniref:Uncharacterized protein n=1 Tax=Chaetoceros tenuissimus TaxID=426638 RepID=A0AAD3CT78_9STRA|nr:predicted protein [Chaetoceros tenuissimus]